MQTILSIWVFTLCLNLGFFFIGNVLGISSLQHTYIDPQAYIQSQTALVKNSTGGNEGFNTVFVFGDFIKAINMFLALYTNQPLIDMIGLICLNCQGIVYFTLPLQAIFAILNTIAIIALLRGVQIF